MCHYVHGILILNNNGVNDVETRHALSLLGKQDLA